MSSIQNGSILWLPKYDEASKLQYVPPDRLHHPIIILSQVEKESVTAVLLTTFNTPLSRDSPKWKTHLPIESSPHPTYQIILRLRNADDWDSPRQFYADVANIHVINRKLLRPWSGRSFQLTSASLRDLIGHVNRFASPSALISPVAYPTKSLGTSQLWPASSSSQSYSPKNALPISPYSTSSRTNSPSRTNSLLSGYPATQRQLPFYSNNVYYGSYVRPVEPYRPKTIRQHSRAVCFTWVIMVAFGCAVAFGLYCGVFMDRQYRH